MQLEGVFCAYRHGGLGYWKKKWLMDDPRDNEKDSRESSQVFPQVQHVWWLLRPSSHQQDEAKVATNYSYNIYKTNVGMGSSKQGTNLFFPAPFFFWLSRGAKTWSLMLCSACHYKEQCGFSLSPVMHHLPSCTRRCELLLGWWNLGALTHLKQNVFSS